MTNTSLRIFFSTPPFSVSNCISQCGLIGHKFSHLQKSTFELCGWRKATCLKRGKMLVFPLLTNILTSFFLLPRQHHHKLELPFLFSIIFKLLYFVTCSCIHLQRFLTQLQHCLRHAVYTNADIYSMFNSINSTLKSIRIVCLEEQDIWNYLHVATF